MKLYISRLGQARGRRSRPGTGPQPSENVLFTTLSFAGFVIAVLLVFAPVLGSSRAHAQSATPSVNRTAGSIQPVDTLSDIMVSMVYPAANNILLSAYRGGPQDEREWIAVQRSAVLLAESGNVLIMRGPSGGQGDWTTDARMLVTVGSAAYKAARAKDANAFIAVAQPLNAACTTCHKQYRANVAGPNERVGPVHQPAE